MKKLVVAFGLAAAAVAASSADAATVIYKPGVFGPPAGYTLVNGFDTTAAQAMITGSNFVFPTGSVSGQYVAPAGDSTPYLAILGGGSATTTFATDVRSFSFDYSTVDSYNLVKIAYADGGSESFTGSFILGALPSGVSSGSFIVNGDGRAIGGLTLSTSSNSFEVDNLAVSAGLGTVPEPASWALMVAGFGLIGFAARLRRPVAI